MDVKYYTGEVKEVLQDGRHVIEYDESDKETLNLDNENWKFLHSLESNAIELLATLPSNEQEILSEMMDVLGQKPFLFHHAQGFDQSVMLKAYQLEQEKYFKHVKPVPRKKALPNANRISSHVVYRIKVEDDQSLKLKARIAPHGNEDSEIEFLKSDCAMCWPLGIRIVVSVSTCRKWLIVKTDTEMAFHQTGTAGRHVFVWPPKESNRQNEL